MITMLRKLFTLLILLSFLAHPASAQESDFQLFEDLPEGFTGALGDAEEDPDSDAYKEREAEESVFGEDEEEPLDEEDIEEAVENAYSLTLTIESEVTFTEAETNDTYLAIKYITKINEEISLISRRWRSDGTAEFETEIVGQFAGNDFFTCILDVEVEKVPIKLMTKLKTIAETEEVDESQEAAIQIKFDKTYKENWRSNCTAVDQSTLNTTGDPEKYNMKILDLLKPSLTALTFEEFEEGDERTIELEAETIEIDDLDTNEIITLSGSGTLTIEPL